MGYSDLPFEQRFHSLGDESETRCAEIAPLGKVERLGWRRPSVSMSGMTEFIRHMPDYYANTGWLIECMGCGRDGLLKLKLSKWQALLEWNRKQQTALFVWNSHHQTWMVMSVERLKRHVRRARARGIKAFSNDGNEYFEIPYDDLHRDQDSIAGSL